MGQTLPLCTPLDVIPVTERGGTNHDLGTLPYECLVAQQLHFRLGICYSYRLDHFVARDEQMRREIDTTCAPPTEKEVGVVKAHCSLEA
jgi:hypothetical protein